MALTEKAPRIVDTVVDEGESAAFIPYPDLGENFENAPNPPARARDGEDLGMTIGICRYLGAVVLRGGIG